MMLSSLVIISFALTASALINETNEASTEAKKSEAKTFYDQRQTGKYNLHVNIKDVQFFSLSDSLASIGGDYDYGDYGSYGELPETDSEYDSSHLTVNPIFATLGSKPTTKKPTVTSTTAEISPGGTIEGSEISTEADKDNKIESTSVKQELETTVKQQVEEAQTQTSPPTNMDDIKPALKPLKVNDSIEYEEIPVEVQYYRANHPKLPVVASSLQQNHNKRLRRPSVQILDGRNNNHNLKIIRDDQLQPAAIKICGRGEFRDNHGRCRLKAAHGRHRVSGLRRVFNVLSSLLPK